jgi:tetratricopeptide (TPR) repeat protein
MWRCVCVASVCACLITMVLPPINVSGQVAEAIVVRKRMNEVKNYLNAGEFAKALNLAINLAEIVPNRFGPESISALEAMSLLAEVRFTLGENAEAEKLLKNALEISKRKYPKEFLTAQLSLDLAVVLPPVEGISYADLATKQMKELDPDGEELGKAYLRLAVLQQQLGYTAESKDSVDNAIRLLGTPSGPSVHIAEAYFMRGAWWLDNGDSQNAKSDLVKALDVWKGMKNSPFVWDTKYAIALLSWDSGNIKKAWEIAKDALQEGLSFTDVSLMGLTEQQKLKLISRMDDLIYLCLSLPEAVVPVTEAYKWHLARKNWALQALAGERASQGRP